MRIPIVTAWCLLVLLLPGSTAVHAHEVGTTRVTVVLEAGHRYVIDVVTDATALAEKLEAAAGRPRGTDTAPARLQALLAASDDIFRRRVAVRFDEGDSRPAIEYRVAPQADPTLPAVATVRLTGEMPEGADEFTWSYAWTFTPYVLMVRNAGSNAAVTEWLDGGDASAPVAVAAPVAPVDRVRTAGRYLALGFTHILPYGVDHVLFVLGLFLLSGRARAVLWQASAFTAAHSITLGLSMFGVIESSPAIVEPLIALSIAYIAVENLFVSHLKTWRIALVFAFGLLHGLGFAGVLKELGLPRAEFLTALLTFNIGVEAGQIAVIAAAFLLVGWHRDRIWYRSRVVVPASLAIACTAIYWTVERLGA